MLQQSDSRPISNDSGTVLLKKIGASFNQTDWEKLVFLCGPWVTAEDEYRIFNCDHQQHASTIDFNLNLLLYAISSSNNILNRNADDKILQELLFLLKKYRSLRTFFSMCKHRLNEEGIQYINPFWKLLFNIVEELDDNSLKFLASKLLREENASRMNHLVPGFRYAKELFTFLNSQNEIAKNNVQRFKQIFHATCMNRSDLLALVEKYEKETSCYQINVATPERKCGYAVIFNHFTFDKVPPEKVRNRTDLEQRHGTHQDASDLEKLWNTYGMETVVHADLTSNELQQEIDDLAIRKDFSTYQIFVCCVLSHGETDVFYASDGVEMSITDLHFTFGKNSKSLIGKPKLFFIQACQGNVNNSFMPDATPSFASTKAHKPTNDGQPSNRQIHPNHNLMSEDSTRPQQADILIGKSTVPRYKSFRHERNGSVYIQTLFEVLMEKGDKYEILELLTEVSKEISKRKIEVESDVGRTREIVCQMPMLTSQLTMKLFLKKAQLQ